MDPLLKREFYNFEWFVFFILFFIPMIYVLDMPISFPTIFTLIFIMSSTFHTDEKFRVNRVMISLPIKRKRIVKVRYIFLVLTLSFMVIYQWIIDHLAHYGLPYLDAAPLNGLTVILLFLGICIVLSLSLPFYYAFQTFRKAAVFHIFSLFLLGFTIGFTFGNPYFDFIYLTIFKLIDIQPFLISLAISFISLLLSYSFSSWIFSKRDII